MSKGLRRQGCWKWDRIPISLRCDGDILMHPNGRNYHELLFYRSIEAGVQHVLLHVTQVTALAICLGRS